MAEQFQDALEEAVAAAQRASDGPYRPSVHLPLREVDWGAQLVSGDLSGDTWPPPRVQERKIRLQTYHDCWRGDVMRLIDRDQLRDASVGPFNFFRRLSKFTADLMVREAPTVGDEEGPFNDVELMKVAHSLGTDATRYGAAFLALTATPLGPMLRVVDARFIDRLEGGGWVIAEPRANSQAPSSAPNAIQFIVVQPDGATSAYSRNIVPGSSSEQFQVGPVTPPEEIGQTWVWAVTGLPHQDGPWGTSLYDDFMTYVVQKARRYAADTRVLDDNSNPILIFKGDLDRYTAVAGGESIAVSGDPASVERTSRLSGMLKRLGRLVAPDGVEGAEYITWEGSLENSRAFVEQLDRDLHTLSGLTAAMSGDSQVPSGMSLRRMLWQFDASVFPVWFMSKAVLSQAVGLYNYELEWENALEVVEGQAETEAVEDVEDEDTARRGEGDGDGGS